MEASVDLSSPKKARRQSYKPLWEQAERRAKAANADFFAQAEDTARAQQATTAARLDALYYRVWMLRLFVVALTEAVVIAILVAR
jgi:hypothetical protein